MTRALVVVALLAFASHLHSADGNRLAYLDDNSPFYPNLKFPKLITPQWIGEEGVDAVVIFAIDDMREVQKYETYLRPILDRLKKIDGRAPVSIMTCTIDPKNEHLQKWLKEGVSLECHTADHPCPMFRKGDLAATRATYEKCVDQLSEVPNSKPVAFRTPCCDSLNTLSPKLFDAIFNHKTQKGNFLQIDSSVFTWFTPNDPDLPRDLVYDKDGRMRFAKYLPQDRTFVNVIEDYPYPYVINRLCWEFPCMTPSDWQAQHLHKPFNPKTVEDWKAALDCTVIKQGVFSVVFHPHGWIKSEQVVDFIDYAQTKYGKRVKFLNFKEALEQLNKNVLAGEPLMKLRDPGGSSPLELQHDRAKLIDVNNDGYMDVVVNCSEAQVTRLWSPKTKRWTQTDFPSHSWYPIFFRWKIDKNLQMIQITGSENRRWSFTGTNWTASEYDRTFGNGLPKELSRSRTIALDIDSDGDPELVDLESNIIYSWNGRSAWRKLPFVLPAFRTIRLSGKVNRAARFVDLNGDGKLDLIYSNVAGYGVYLFESMEKGWSHKVLECNRTEKDKNELPPIDDRDGAWIANKHIWWINENTDLLKDLLDKRAFADLVPDVGDKPKSPEESLKMMQPRKGFQVELVAAEPLVEDPIAFAFGPDGKLWVVEMGDYPLGIDGKGTFGGRIKFLESTKGDGKYDKATVFLDGLGFPTGVLPWRKGVLITCAPDILYAEDTDGDGKADVKKVLFTGFAKGNQQHRVNSLVWGLDNWIHCANGDSGGLVTSSLTGKKVALLGRDFRIKPDTGEIELEAGQSQFGRCRDDWDNWFGGNNSNPMWHVAVNDRYLKRNPHVASPPPTIPVSVTPGPSVVYPISKTHARFNDFAMANRFTSACSPIVYRDNLFPVADGSGSSVNVFICEPVHNLVHREVMTAEGTTFKSRRGPDEERSEFLASSDNWFRPTMLATGPDGALWVADMYRHVIEHPEWIPKDWQKKLDLRAGHDKGRIYRVYPVGAKLRAVPRFDKMTTEELVAALDSPNGWQRDMAQMMLIWKEDKKAVEPLQKLLIQSKNPLARLHALSTLDGMKALDAEIAFALDDQHPGIVRHALRLCESRCDDALVQPFLQNSGKHPDAQVRLQLAYTLGEWKHEAAGKRLAELAFSARDNRYFIAAVMSSLNETNLPSFAQTVLSAKDAEPSFALYDGLLAFATAKNDRMVLARLLAAVAETKDGRYESWQYEALGGMLETLRRKSISLAGLNRDANDEMKAMLAKTNPLFTDARKKVRDPKARTIDLVRAIPLLGHSVEGPADDLNLLWQLLSPQHSSEVQSAALTALAGFGEERLPTKLFAGWKGYTPTVRTQALSILIGRTKWIDPLLDALDKQQILAADIDAASRQRLLTHNDATIRQRAEKLLAGAIDADRQKVIDNYKPALTKMGDRERGKAIFTKSCSACHKLGDVGQGLAPDLAALSDKSPEYLLLNILDPNRGVEARYLSYTATLKDGTQRVGFLQSETATSLTMVGPDGKPLSVLRTDIDELRSSGKSVMPEGIEKEISIDQMADLLSYLRSYVAPAFQPAELARIQPAIRILGGGLASAGWKAGATIAPKRKEFPGNVPQVLQPNPDGSVRLPAISCEIYGTSLVFESKYNNLGFWGNENDHAVWTINIPKGGKYDVTLDYACDQANAGNAFVVMVGDNKLIGRIETTGSWDTYKSMKIGSMTLKEGEQKIVLRSNGAIRGYLMDLRGLRLTPGKE